MSDSEDDGAANVPSAAECELRCQEFASITSTDSALAMYYLQDRDWIVERALDAYFTDNESSARAMPAKTTAAHKSVEASSSSTSSLSQSNLNRSLKHKSDEALSGSKKKKVSDERPRDTVKSSKDSSFVIDAGASSSRTEDDNPDRIRLLSWNIDGLDQTSIAARAKAVAQTILKEKPDVVFLQEVVAQNLSVLTSDCPGYRFIAGNTSGPENYIGEYFVAMMLNNDTVKYISHTVTPFRTSQMTRALLEVTACVKDVNCILLTSHLESTADHAEERKRQLKTAFSRMLSAGDDQTVLFGGDLNLRDKELGVMQSPPTGISDVWMATGSRAEAQYTWDMLRNDNLQWAGRYKPRCRFDRLYLRSKGSRLQPVYLELIGLERIPSCGRFASDHWGMLAHFNKK